VTVRQASLDALGVDSRIVLGPPPRIFEGYFGRVWKALLDDRAEHLVTGLFVAVDASFVRELETDAAGLDPSHGAVELTVVTEHQPHMIPKVKLEISTDHSAAGGQVHKFDNDIVVGLAQDRLFR
jgi:hypothetical protein